MKMTIAEIATTVGAMNDWQKWATTTVTSVEFDARLVQTGSLFVPLQGGERDGHEFAEQALKNGATLAFWSAAVTEMSKDLPVLVVADTLMAFQQLAQLYLAKVSPKVIGITGSNGKTTTKDMVAAVLSQGYRTYKTQGNYNNDIGLPYTILKMPVLTEMLVLEMGMDHAGEIAFLSRLARPDVAAITMIGESHIEYLGSRQGIAQAKMEIIAGLDREGLLVVPGAEPLLRPLLESVEQHVMTFGLVASNDVSAEIILQTKTDTHFKSSLTASRELVIPVIGSYNVSNALIALIIGKHFGLREAEIAEGLASLELTRSRTEWLKASNGAEILSDVYNANPTAMGLVIDAFSELTCQGDKHVVLADMAELGQESQTMHERMAEHLDPTKVKRVYLYGAQMGALYLKLQGTFSKDCLFHFDITHKEALLQKIKAQLKESDMIMLKGSNSMKLIEIVEKIIEN